MSLNTPHKVTLTEGQISTILYTMEGYMQGSDDREDSKFHQDVDNIFEILETVVDGRVVLGWSYAFAFFIKDEVPRNLKLDSMWINYMSAGDFNPWHEHSRCGGIARTAIANAGKGKIRNPFRPAGARRNRPETTNRPPRRNGTIRKGGNGRSRRACQSSLV